MPAQRLPWFRFWVAATSHAKVRTLDDGTFRTWVELLDAAAQQPKRGRFASRAEAAAITRRPAKHIATLIGASLIDESTEGLTMHDWDDWQRWRKEDTNDSRTTTDHPPNGHVIATPTATQSPAEQHTNIAVPLREKKKRDRDIDVDVERDDKTASLRASLPSPSLERSGGFRQLGSLLPKRPVPPAPPPGFRTEESVGERFDRRARQASQPANGINSQSTEVA